MNIRPFRADDATACCAIINAAIEHMDGLNPTAREFVTSKNVPDQLCADVSPAFTLVGCDGDDVVAVGVLDDDEIKRVYVVPSYHGRGAGSALVRALLDEARRRGAQRAVVQASPSSVGFYRTLGFRSLREETSRRGGAVFVHVRMELVF